MLPSLLIARTMPKDNPAARLARAIAYAKARRQESGHAYAVFTFSEGEETSVHAVMDCPHNRRVFSDYSLIFRA